MSHGDLAQAPSSHGPAAHGNATLLDDEHEHVAPAITFAPGTGSVPPPGAGFGSSQPSASDLAFGDGCQLCGTPKATMPVPAIPPRHLHSHTDPHAHARTPVDEVEIDWMSYVKLTDPGDPFITMPVVPGTEPPFPPGTHVEPAMPERCHETDASELAGLGPREGKVTIDEGHMDERRENWRAYRAAAQHVDQVQQAVAPEVNRFRHAERDPELRALGFMLDRARWKGDLATLAEAQQVPHRGGLQVGALFRGARLAKTVEDDRAIQSAGLALQHGVGGVEDAFLGTEKADAGLQAALADCKAASERVEASHDDTEARMRAVEEQAAAMQAMDARSEIQALNQEIQATRSVLGLLFTLPGKLLPWMQQAKPGAGADAAGVTGNTIIGLIPDERLEAAQRRLAEAEHQMQDAQCQKVQAELAAARAESLAAMSDLRAARARLLQHLTVRRLAYNHAGQEAGHVAHGADASRQRVAAFIAAIPIVEAVVGSIGAIVGMTKDAAPQFATPIEKRAARLGYGMARYAQTWEAEQLPATIGRLRYINVWFGTLGADWRERLQALVEIKDRIAGPRPEAEEDH